MEDYPEQRPRRNRGDRRRMRGWYDLSRRYDELYLHKRDTGAVAVSRLFVRVDGDYTQLSRMSCSPSAIAPRTPASFPSEGGTIY